MSTAAEASASPAAVRRTGPPDDVLAYLQMLGDDALVSAQRLTEWATRAPQIELDVALLNLALDQLGQARTLYRLAGEREGAGRGEDDFAYLREEPEFRNAQLTELPNGDFGRTIVRLLLFAGWQRELYRALAGSADRELAAFARAAGTEVAYHWDFAADWTRRLGDGTAESRARTQDGLAAVWPYTFELFESGPVTDRLCAAGVAPDPATLREPWLAAVRPVLREATLETPEGSFRPTGGRRGLHTEAFGYLIAELQHLHRSHPGAAW